MILIFSLKQTKLVDHVRLFYRIYRNKIKIETVILDKFSYQYINVKCSASVIVGQVMALVPQASGEDDIREETLIR